MSMFKTLPKHGSVLDLFPPATSQPVSAFGARVAPAHQQAEEDMDRSFGTQDTSIDSVRDFGGGSHDVSFASTISLASPISPPSGGFRPMESSPYGMDICSPSPGHPMYGKRISAQVSVADSGSKVFGQYGQDISIPSIHNPPGTLLKRLTADISDSSFNSSMSTGSMRSRGSTGKVGSIKTISTVKDERDPLSKARARARTGLPSSWMQARPHSMFESQTMNVLSPVEGSSEEAGDVSMEDAMDVDSPLAVRRPPKAQVKPRPLSLLIPSTVPSPALTNGSSAGISAAPPSSIPSVISTSEQFAQYFFDTPEQPEKTAIPKYNADGSEASPYPFGRTVDSSPVASPSADKLMRCLSAGVQPSSGFPASLTGSNTSTLNSGPRTAGPIPASRIPSLRSKVLHRPGLSTLAAAQPTETHSAGIVPSARMVPVSQRRAVSAYIQPEQLHSAPFSIQGAAGRTAIPRPTNGLAKNRVVSMLVPPTASDDADDSGNDFSSPSLPRSLGVGHRRMRSNGGSASGALTLGSNREIGRGGSMAMRAVSQQVPKGGNLFAQPLQPSAAPVKAVLPFGDGEHHGKILPCHSIKEDGLMRITPSTLHGLLSGAFDAQIDSYLVIDCRFGFEFEGGHINGAVNLNKDEDIERFLFDEVISRGQLPAPCVSGQPGMRPPILVFHCEFSAKRGPTFAKHFRAKDRARNAVEYPRLHYPELYILEGGYCSYYSAYPETCEPQGYVKMDAPAHMHARAADLGQFRKWSRARSYTYGDAQGPTQAVPASGLPSSQSTETNQYKRSAPPSALLYANHEKLHSYHGLSTLQESHSPRDELDQQDVEATPDLDHGEEFDEDVPDHEVLTEVDGDEYYDAPEALQEANFEDDDDLDLREFGVSEATVDLDDYHSSREAPSDQPEEEEDEDELDHLESSPCVTAEMKRNKNRGRSLLERTFKPLSFGKPFSLSREPSVPSRVAKAISRA